MKVYRTDQHRIDRPSKMVVRPDGYEVTSNDGKIRVELHRSTNMEGSMESMSYHTVMWIEEDGGWTRVGNTQSYRSKEDFIKAISEAEGFTEAMAEYRFNSKNNSDL